MGPICQRGGARKPRLSDSCYIACVVFLVTFEEPQRDYQGLFRDPSKLPATLLAFPRISITRGPANFCQREQCGYLGDPNLMINGQKSLIDAHETRGSRSLCGK
ncbi:NmrA-like family protein [Penicillium majusculum]|nr:NmrA-like family protein [Penicillium majusculum]